MMSQRMCLAKRIKLIALFGLSLFLLPGHVIAQEKAQAEQEVDVRTSQKKNQVKSIDARLVEVNKLYNEKKYESAYDDFKGLYVSFHLSSSENDQVKLLDWGIRLSFLVENFKDLEGYINQYYILDPNFSAANLKESNPLLNKYIDSFIRSKDELFVYVNKHKQSLDLITASITVFTKHDIQRLGARNLLDLIRLAPGFAELGDNNERLIGTRGSSSTSLQDVLILIDGHRISDILTNTNAPDWLNLDYVEQVELMRGPGSALYGGNAFNAVINVITKNGRLSNTNGIKVQIGTGNDFSNVSFPRNTYRVSYEYGRRLSNLESFYFNGSVFQSGGSQVDLNNYNDVLPDIRSGDTLRPASNNGKEFINAYAPGYNFLLNYSNQSFKMTANAESNSFIVPRPVSMNLWESFNSDIPKTRTDRREFIQTSYNLFEKSPEFKHSLTFKLSGDHMSKDIYFPQYSSTSNQSQRLLGHEYRATTNLEFSSDSLTKHKLFKGQQFVLAGVEAYVNHWDYEYSVTSDTGSSFVTSGITDYFTQLEPNKSQNEYIAAAYFQIEQHFVPERLIGTFGVRINYHSEYSKFNEFTWGRQYSPRFALIYRAAGNGEGLYWLKLKLLYNSAFLPPPFLYRRRGIRGFRGADQLKSQEIESGEFIISGDITKNLSYGVFLYSNKLDNIIARSGDVYENKKSNRINSGLDTEIKYHATLGRIETHSFINYSYAFEVPFNDTLSHTYFEVLNPSFYNQKSSLRNYPVHMFNAGVDFTTVKRKKEVDIKKSNKPSLSFGFNIQYIGQSTVALSQNELRDLPSAVVLDTRARVIFKKLTLGISAKNLANNAYFLPALAFRTKMLRAENRMIFLNIQYNFN
jgi:outer membrane receptor protein involved in Fe transport